jgi:UDP-GlcNAc3NAcA epimerase
LKKIFTVIGARPQFVKAAAVSRALKAFPAMREILVHTGQHYDHNMSAVFFEEMEIPEPEYNLDVHGGSHGEMTGRMLEKLEEKLIAEKPDLVMVYGDTNSTLAGALAARKLNIPVAHVEAGLRSFRMSMPEEINRILTDRISSLLFCPTETAVKNLTNEGYANFPCTILQSGDVMYDSALYYSKRTGNKSGILQRLSLDAGSFVLCTIHRQENTDNEENLRSIFSSLNEINRETRIVLPLHPRTKKILEKYRIRPLFPVIEPVGYFDILSLLLNCRLVITDSGGMQKEAYFFNKFCMTLREETEWTELVDHGYNILAGVNPQKILQTFRHFMNAPFPSGIALYGDGTASEKIAVEINRYLS